LRGWNSVLALIELSLNIEFTNWIFADIHNSKRNYLNTNRLLVVFFANQF